MNKEGPGDRKLGKLVLYVIIIDFCIFLGRKEITSGIILANAFAPRDPPVINIWQGCSMLNSLFAL